MENDTLGYSREEEDNILREKKYYLYQESGNRKKGYGIANNDMCVGKIVERTALLKTILQTTSIMGIAFLVLCSFGLISILIITPDMIDIYTVGAAVFLVMSIYLCIYTNSHISKDQYDIYIEDFDNKDQQKADFQLLEVKSKRLYQNTYLLLDRYEQKLGEYTKDVFGWGVLGNISCNGRKIEIQQKLPKGTLLLSPILAIFAVFHIDIILNKYSFVDTDSGKILAVFNGKTHSEEPFLELSDNCDLPPILFLGSILPFFG